MVIFACFFVGACGTKFFQKFLLFWTPKSGSLGSEIPANFYKRLRHRTGIFGNLEFGAKMFDSGLFELIGLLLGTRFWYLLMPFATKLVELGYKCVPFEIPSAPHLLQYFQNENRLRNGMLVSQSIYEVVATTGCGEALPPKPTNHLRWV